MREHAVLSFALLDDEAAVEHRYRGTSRSQAARKAARDRGTVAPDRETAVPMDDVYNREYMDEFVLQDPGTSTAHLYEAVAYEEALSKRRPDGIDDSDMQDGTVVDADVRYVGSIDLDDHTIEEPLSDVLYRESSRESVL